MFLLVFILHLLVMLYLNIRTCVEKFYINSRLFIRFCIGLFYPLHSSKFRPVETFDLAIFVRFEVGCERLGTSDPNWSSGKDQTPCGIVAWSSLGIAMVLESWG